MTVDTVYIRGNFAEGNFGDEALLAATVSMIAAAGLRPVIVGPPSPYHAIAAHLHHAAEVDPDYATLVLFGGGTQFFSMPGSTAAPSARPQGLLQRVARAALEPDGFARRLAQRRHSRRVAAVPHAAVGLGVGAFRPEDETNETQVARLLGQMAFLWLRDGISMAFCARHGITQARAGPDLCFTDAGFRLLEQNEAAPAHVDRGKIAIVLREHPCLDDGFRETLARVVADLRRRGDAVEFVSFSPATDGMEPIARALDAPLRCWSPTRETIADFARTLASFDLLLTARFHGAIFGMLTGTPCVTLGIDDKLEGVAARHPEIGMICIAPHASAETYIAAIAETRSRREAMVAGMRVAVAAERALATPVEKAFTDFLRSLAADAGTAGQTSACAS